VRGRSRKKSPEPDCSTRKKSPEPDCSTRKKSPEPDYSTEWFPETEEYRPEKNMPTYMRARRFVPHRRKIYGYATAKRAQERSKFRVHIDML